MKRINSFFTAGLVLALIALFVNACGSGSSSASDTLSSGQQAQVQSMIDAALTKNTLALHLHGGGTVAAAGALHTESTGTDTCASGVNLGTLMGVSPGSDARVDDVLSGKSTTGYIFAISGAASSSDCGVIQQIPLQLVYDGPNCTGTPYTPYPSAQAIAGGMVIRIDLTNADSNGFDPTTYWYLPAAESEQTVNVQSVYLPGRGCQTSTGVTADYYKLLANDPATTGIPNQPVIGPILPTD